MIKVEKGKINLKGTNDDITLEFMLLLMSIKKDHPELLEGIAGGLCENGSGKINLYNKGAVTFFKKSIYKSISEKIDEEKLEKFIDLLQKLTIEFSNRLDDAAGIYHVDQGDVLGIATISLMETLNECMEIEIVEK